MMLEMGLAGHTSVVGYSPSLYTLGLKHKIYTCIILLFLHDTQLVQQGVWLDTDGLASMNNSVRGCAHTVHRPTLSTHGTRYAHACADPLPNHS